jgi:antitoxin HigA-1
LWLKPLDMSITKAADKLQVSRKTLSGIVNGKVSINVVMALKLEEKLGKSAESWLEHQVDYDVWQARQRFAA